LSIGQFTKKAGKYTLKIRRKNIKWGDIDMTGVALRKLIIHFAQSNKVEGKSTKNTPDNLAFYAVPPLL